MKRVYIHNLAWKRLTEGKGGYERHELMACEDFPLMEPDAEIRAQWIELSVRPQQ